MRGPGHHFGRRVRLAPASGALVTLFRQADARLYRASARAVTRPSSPTELDGYDDRPRSDRRRQRKPAPRLSALLTQAGYQVVAALPDGNRWWNGCGETPDIVCLDYHLPGRDGLSLLADIDKAFPRVDVLFMTASGEASLEQRAA